MKKILIMLVALTVLSTAVFAGSVATKEKRKVAQVENEDTDCVNAMSQAERNVCEHEAFDKLNRKLIDMIDKKCLSSSSVQEFSPDGTGYSAAIVRCKSQVTGQLIEALGKITTE